MRPIFRGLIFGLLFAATAVVAAAQDVHKAPVLVLKDLRGPTLRLTDYKGRVVLLNFWATWCPPCRAEIPDLIKAQRDYRKDGLQIIGITYPPQTRAQVRRFARRFRINYPIALGSAKTKSLFDDSDVLPITVIIDRDGNLRELIKGIIFSDEFDQKIKPLLHQPH